MGYSRFDHDDWTAYATANAGKTRAARFTSRSVTDIDELNPNKFGMRESRDSVANPRSTPIIAGLDVTGSMGFLAEVLVRDGIGTAFKEILERAKDPTSGMISDPHLMVMGLGDVRHDRAPVQATQFETDLTIAKQTEKIYLEGGGGGNSTESYDAAWYMAAMRTKTDAWDKRGEKGYLFTVGDEEAPLGMTRAHIAKFFGEEANEDLDARQLLAMAEERYNVFHIVVAEGSHARMRGAENVKRTWQDLMGQRVMILEDHTKLAELMVSVLQVSNGASASTVAASWSGDTSLVIARGLRELAGAGPALGGVVRF